MKTIFEGFKSFILRGNVIDLAVGVVIGASFNAVVTSLVANIISPLLAMGGGVPDLSGLKFTLLGATFKYGMFIDTLISFLITATVIYFFVVLPLNRLMLLTDPLKGKKPEKAVCPFCREKIDASASRCPHCTSELKVTGKRGK